MPQVDNDKAKSAFFFIGFKLEIKAQWSIVMRQASNIEYDRCKQVSLCVDLNFQEFSC